MWAVSERGSIDQAAGQELHGRTGWVAWAPDGSALASASGDSTVRVWAVSEGGNIDQTGRQVLQGHTGSVYAVAWAPLDGTALASGSVDKTVRVWSLLSVPSMMAALD